MRFIKRLIPRVLTEAVKRQRTRLELFQESYLDARRYASAAASLWHGRRVLREHLESEIVRRCHVIEKGLSMPDFRPRFGIEMVQRLVKCLEEWKRQPGCGQSGEPTCSILSGAAVLFSYAEKHRKLGIDVTDLIPKCYRTRDGLLDESLAGTRELESVSKEDGAAFRRIVLSRASVRDFEMNRIPPRELVERCVEMAARSPSVCNRQTWRVHAFEGQRAQDVLALQDGNRGFGHTIPVVLIVTCDLRYFIGVIERYQAWIDGGMFAMTLLLALHAEGLGAVSLNWSVRNARDAALRSSVGIPEYERIIMLIGCGYAREGAITARSLRWPTSAFLRWTGDRVDA